MTTLRAVALGQHHHRAAGGLELLDVGVHPAGRGRAERAGRHARRASWPGRRSRRGGRCRYCGISSPASSRSLILACAMSRATTSGPVSESRVLTGCLRQLGEDLGHRPVEVDRARPSPPAMSLGDAGVGHVVRRVGLELLEEDALGGDLAERLPVGRAGDRDRDRARGAVAGQPDDADVVAEVLAAELRADPERLGQLEDLLLELEVAEAVRRHRCPRSAGCRGSAPRRTSRSSARTPRDVPPMTTARWYGGQAAVPSERIFSSRNSSIRVGVQDRLGLLEEERLVGRAAALGHEEELVLRLPVPSAGVE